MGKNIFPSIDALTRAKCILRACRSRDGLPRGQSSPGQVESAEVKGLTSFALFHSQLHRVLSSDKVANIDESLVRLQLHLEHPSSNRREISLELSREELERVIAELEKAKKALDQLKEQ